MTKAKHTHLTALQARLHEIIYEADTPAGRVFDVSLIVLIITSVIVVMLESVEGIGKVYGTLFHTLEWIFTIIFTIEYILRLYCIGKPMKYATSFFVIIDLLSTIPTYIAFFFIGSTSQYFVMIRSLRLLRVFRVFRLANYTRQGNIILISLRKSKDKIFVFLTFVLLVVAVVGSIMYVIEGETNENFSNIPTSIYWAIVTVTTVGYGDISPVTPLGQFLAAALMIMGYVVIAVPTGIVSAGLMNNGDGHEQTNTQACVSCSKEGHDDDAEFCKYCGEALNPDDLVE